MDRAKKEQPNNVSGLVVNILMFLNSSQLLILKSISQPKDFPIQFFCITFTFFGHLSNFSNPFKRSSENLVILKNH